MGEGGNITGLRSKGCWQWLCLGSRRGGSGALEGLVGLGLRGGWAREGFRGTAIHASSRGQCAGKGRDGYGEPHILLVREAAGLGAGSLPFPGEGSLKPWAELGQRGGKGGGGGSSRRHGHWWCVQGWETWSLGQGGCGTGGTELGEGSGCAQSSAGGAPGGDAAQDPKPSLFGGRGAPETGVEAWAAGPKSSLGTEVSLAPVQSCNGSHRVCLLNP